MLTDHDTVAARFSALGAALAAFRWLWRPQPFKEIDPPWCDALPALAVRLAGLSDGQVAAYAADSTACLSLLADHVPEVVAINELQQLPELPAQRRVEVAAPLTWDIPGRKWQQIEALATNIAPAHRPVVEWCGGKGHLGRVLSAQWSLPVTTLEREGTLCREGERLAGRVSAAQTFCCCDVCDSSVAPLLASSHVVALHACGHLHRTLVTTAIAADVPALDIAPCCYAHGVADGYRGFSHQNTLELWRDDLRLAVTQTATSSAAEQRERDREMAWKLGYDLLRREITGVDQYRNIASLPKAWRKLSLDDLCRRLAARDGIALPTKVDWQHYEKAAWERQRQVMRFSLVRFAFRRALEVWLVLDMALHLRRNGYQMSIGTFCAEETTPRNILLSARLT